MTIFCSWMECTKVGPVRCGRPWYWSSDFGRAFFVPSVKAILSEYAKTQITEAIKQSTTSTMAISTIVTAPSLTSQSIIGLLVYFLIGGCIKWWRSTDKKSTPVDHIYETFIVRVHYEKQTFTISPRRTSPLLSSTTLLIRRPWPRYSVDRRTIYPTIDDANLVGAE